MKVEKGYKQTEIGIIPEDWEVKSIGEIALRFLNGGTPSTDIPNYWNGDIPWITGADFNNHEVNNIRRFITKDAVINSSTNIVSKGNLLVVTRTGVGKIAIAPFDIAISQDITGLYLRENINPHYAFCYLNHNSALLISLNQGTSITGITREVFEKVLIPIPPTLAEQTAIAATLSDTDALIAALDTLIAKKKLIKQGAMQELLTGKKRLPGFSEEWVDKKLGEIGGIIMGQSPPSQYYNDKKVGIPLIQGNADIENRKTIKRNYTSIVTKKCDEGDVLLSVRAPVGAVAKAQFKACIGRGLCAIKTENDFLYHYLIYIENEWDKYSKGSTFDSINSNELKDITICLPINKSEQTAIAQILSDMDSEITALEGKRDKYKQVKAGMMQELLTGQIRLVNTSAQSQGLSESRTISIAAHIVGGHIVNKLYGSKGWGRTKLQKSMHLVDYCCQLDFGCEYIRNIAGPDNQLLMNYIDAKFKQYRHVRIDVKHDDRGGKHYNYIPTIMIADIEQAFGRSYPTETQEAINNLLNKIKKMDLARAEIVSTLYAVWNNRIIKRQSINDDLLLRDFYDWSAHKSDFSPDLVLRGLNYMRREGIIPIGWGKYIDKSKV